MKTISIILFTIGISLMILLICANSWGNSQCKKSGGNWVQINGGSYCVDNNFSEIDIYK